MTLIYVESSNIEAVEYDPAQSELTVVFKSGDTYKYSSVPQFIYDELVSAPSVGSYFNRMVKTVYSFTKQ